MPRQIYLTKELVYSSPSDQQGEEKLYHTPFGLVREDVHQHLYIWHEEKWALLWEGEGQLLLDMGQLNEAGCPRFRCGLAARTIYDGNVDYLLDKLKTYWWALLPLVCTFVIVMELRASRLWVSAAFIAIVSVIIYREGNKSGIKQALVCLLLSLATFGALIFSIEIMYKLLQAIQSLMGLCDGISCEQPHIFLKHDPHDDSDLIGGIGHYGL